jgi:menaquinone-specific isochorismate synthase
LLAALTETSLRSAVDRALSRGRRAVLSITTPIEGADPCAAVFSSRLASDRWFCWEQPDRRFALAALGVVHEATSRGDDRFAEVAAECLGLFRDAVVEKPSGLPPGAGAVWVGGFAFDSGGGASSTWSSFSPGSMILPELSLCRNEGETFLTLNALLTPGEDPAAKSAALWARLAGVRSDPLPLLDPHPTSRTEIRSVRAPG